MNDIGAATAPTLIQSTIKHSDRLDVVHQNTFKFKDFSSHDNHVKISNMKQIGTNSARLDSTDTVRHGTRSHKEHT